MTMARSYLLSSLMILLTTPVWSAEIVGSRHGSIPAMSEAISVESGITVTFQHASDSRVEDELLASFDLVSTLPAGNGHWLIYVEGNTSPRTNGVSSMLSEANGDAGSALDRDGKGRLQVSNLHYLWYLDKDALVVGLIDPTGPLDNSDIANDETGQFLSSTLVNNPTIAFPDYTLGAVYFMTPDNRALDFTFLVSSSHGLADNPNASYSELVDVGETGKGVFTSAEALIKQGNHNWRVGGWVQTADNPYLDGSGNTANNYGLYMSSDHQFGLHRLNLRLGLANDKVSEAASFIGLAVDHALGKNHAGVGLTRTFVSDHAGSERRQGSARDLLSF